MSDIVLNNAIDLLRKSEGLVLGDIHDRMSMPAWIADNLKGFASKANTRMIFLEALPVSHQWLIDDYEVSAPHAARRLKTLLHSMYGGLGDGLFDICEQAKIHGIKIVALEEGTSIEHRLAESNPQWEETVNRYKKKLSDGQTYLLMAGQSHTQRGLDVKGVDERLGIPSLDIYDVGHVQRIRNEWCDNILTEDKICEHNTFEGIDLTSVPLIASGINNQSSLDALIPNHPEQQPITKGAAKLSPEEQFEMLSIRMGVDRATATKRFMEILETGGDPSRLSELISQDIEARIQTPKYQAAWLDAMGELMQPGNNLETPSELLTQSIAILRTEASHPAR